MYNILSKEITYSLPVNIFKYAKISKFFHALGQIAEFIKNDLKIVINFTLL